VQDLIRQIFKRNGLYKERLHFDLFRIYPVKPYTLQDNETDWDFIIRFSANSGICFYSIAKDEWDVVVFTDHNAHCLYIFPSGANETALRQVLVGVYHPAASLDVSHFSDEYSACHNMATCIKREIPFRSKIVSHPEIPMTLTARIAGSHQR